MSRASYEIEIKSRCWRINNESFYFLVKYGSGDWLLHYFQKSEMIKILKIQMEQKGARKGKEKGLQSEQAMIWIKTVNNLIN